MIGETIGNFEIVAPLGKGGMGEVWLAEQKNIKTRVAIKVLNVEVSKDQSHVQRFFNEAIAVSKIRHAGIVKIFDSGYLGSTGQAYLVMEYLEGESLANRIRRAGVLPIGQVAEIARQIASVLDATHIAGVTHRDLKPDNIHLVPDSELPSGERVKVLDFGIAKLSGNVTITSTATGTMGTPLYMSPEQWKSAAKADWRSDVYSLGCVVFEMACGRPPFVAETIGEACAKHLSEPPPLTSSITGGLPVVFDELVDQCLDKDPQKRPSMRDTMIAFAQLAASYAADPAAQHTGGISAQMLTPGTAPTIGGTSVPPHTPITGAPIKGAPITAGAQLGNATTLGSSVGQSVAYGDAPPAGGKKRSKAPIFAGIALLAAGGAAAGVYAMRDRGKPETPAPPVASAPTPPAPTTPPAPPRPPVPPPPEQGSAAIEDPAKLVAPTSTTAPLVLAKSLSKLSGEMPKLKSAVPITPCLDASGAVTSVAIPDDVAADVQDDIRKRVMAWRYKPYAHNGQPSAVCTQIVLPAVAPPVVAVKPPGEGSGSKPPPGTGSSSPPHPGTGSGSSTPVASCDEVSCVLSNYEGACCKAFKKKPRPCEDVDCAIDPTRPCCKKRPGNPGPPDGPTTGPGDGPTGELPTNVTRPDIAQAMSAVRGRVQACFAQFSVTGVVKTQVRVEPDGRVGSASSSAVDASANECIVGAIKTARFPRTRNGGAFNYPFFGGRR